MKLSTRVRTRQAPWALHAYTVADDQTTGVQLDEGLQAEIAALCEKAAALSLSLQVDFKAIAGVFRTHQVAPSTRGEWRPVAADAQPMFVDLRDRIAAARNVEALANDQVTSERGPDAPGEHDAADPGSLEEFLQYSLAHAPAVRSALFMYGHASGPMGLFYDDDGRKGVPHPLRLTDLARALATKGVRPELVLFRDCYMSNLEVAVELRDQTPFILASQSEVAASGIWPWPAVADAMHELASTRDVALAVGDVMRAFFAVPENRRPFDDAPFSVIDVQAARALDEPLRALTSALVAARADADRRTRAAAAIDGARRGQNSPSCPGDPALLDMHTLCDALGLLPWADIREPANTLRAALDTVVIQHSAQKDDFRGLGLYCRPVRAEHVSRSYIQAGSDADWAQDRAYYAGLKLSQVTGWDKIALDPLVP